MSSVSATIVAAHRAGLVDAAREMAEQVKRCLIGPVNVFERQNRRRLDQLIEDGREEHRAVRVALEERPQRGRRLPGNVVERTQWARGKEGLTGGPE